MTGSRGAGDAGDCSGVPTADRKTRDDGGISVEETSGVAQTEAAGKIGTDAFYEEAQKHSGSG